MFPWGKPEGVNSTFLVEDFFVKQLYTGLCHKAFILEGVPLDKPAHNIRAVLLYMSGGAPSIYRFSDAPSCQISQNKNKTRLVYFSLHGHNDNGWLSLDNDHDFEREQLSLGLKWEMFYHLTSSFAPLLFTIHARGLCHLNVNTGMCLKWWCCVFLERIVSDILIALHTKSICFSSVIWLKEKKNTETLHTESEVLIILFHGEIPNMT